jgi:hypothetical protein
MLAVWAQHINKLHLQGAVAVALAHQAVLELLVKAELAEKDVLVGLVEH